MWGLLEGGHLFFAKRNRILDDEQHLAEMVSLLGPPPLEFLKRSEKCYQYWDSQGTTSVSKEYSNYLSYLSIYSMSIE
jgi:serine/threonine-protein kinase SRPK3